MNESDASDAAGTPLENGSGGAVVVLPSPHACTGNLVYFPRMLAKIRLHLAGRLPDEYRENFGDAKPWVLDDICCRFLRLPHREVIAAVEAGGTDEDVLARCWVAAGARSEHEIGIWSGWMTRIGWRDAQVARIAAWKKDMDRENDVSLQTLFDMLDAEEGRR